VYWGPPGTGKTHRAAVEAGDDSYPVPPQKASGLYFDGYSGQTTIVIDDMRGARMTHTQLLLLLDKRPLKLSVIGGFVPAKFTRVIITSNMHPFYWYQELHTRHDYEWGALERRINTITKLTEVYRPPGGVARAPHVVPPPEEGGGRIIDLTDDWDQFRGPAQAPPPSRRREREEAQQAAVDLAISRRRLDEMRGYPVPGISRYLRGFRGGSPDLPIEVEEEGDYGNYVATQMMHGVEEDPEIDTRRRARDTERETIVFGHENSL